MRTTTLVLILSFFFSTPLTATTKHQPRFEKFSSPIAWSLLKPPVKPGEKYPLLVYLHSGGQRGSDNRKPLAEFPSRFASEAWSKRYRAFVLVPQCPSEKKWRDVEWGEKEPHRVQPPNETLQSVIEIISKLTTSLPIDPTRIYLTGISMGGFGTWALLENRPKLFAAAAVGCAGGDPALAKQLAEIPVWIWHGENDSVVPLIQSTRMVEALKKVGGKVRYTEVKNGPHDIGSTMYQEELIDWLFQQKKNAF